MNKEELYCEGIALLEEDKVEEAVERFYDALDKGSEDDMLTPSIYNVLGSCLVILEEDDKALEALNRAIELYPAPCDELAHAYSQKAELYSFQNKMDKSLKEYNKAIEIWDNLIKHNDEFDQDSYIEALDLRGDILEVLLDE